MRRHGGAGPVRLHPGYQTACIRLCRAIEHAEIQRPEAAMYENDFIA